MQNNKPSIKVPKDVKPGTAKPSDFRGKTAMANRGDKDLPNKFSNFIYKKSSKLSENTFDVNSSMANPTRRVRFLFAKEPVPPSSVKIHKSPLLIK